MVEQPDPVGVRRRLLTGRRIAAARGEAVEVVARRSAQRPADEPAARPIAGQPQRDRADREAAVVLDAEAERAPAIGLVGDDEPVDGDWAVRGQRRPRPRAALRRGPSSRTLRVSRLTSHEQKRMSTQRLRE